MSDTVQKDILLGIKSEADLTAFDAAQKKIADLLKVVEQANARFKLKLGVEGGAGSGGGPTKNLRDIENAEKGAANAAALFTQKLHDQERALGVVAQKVREVNQIFANGKTAQTHVFSAPGLNARFNQTTGASIVSAATTEAQQAAAAEARVAAEFEAQKKIGSLRAEEEDAFISGLQIQKNQALLAAEARVTAEFEAQKKIGALRAKAEDDEIARAANRRSFRLISSQPGVTTRKGRERIDSGGNIVQDTEAIDRQGNVIAKLDAETGKASISQKDFNVAVRKSGDSLLHAAGKVALWTAATGLVFGTLNGLREGVRVFAELQDATVALERVGRGFGATFSDIEQASQHLVDRIVELKVAYGSSGDEAFKAAQTFAQLGLNEQQVAEATKSAIQLGNIAGGGAGEAANQLAAAIAEFGISASEIPSIVGKIDIAARSNRVNIKDLLDAYSRSGAVIHELGGSFEFFTAATAVAAQETGRTGSEIGNAFKTIATNLGNADVEAKIFSSTGIVIRNLAGEIKPIDQILGELSVKFNQLSAAQREDVAAAVAGARQKNILLTILRDFNKIKEEESREFSATNAVAAENARINDTLSGSYTRLKNSLESYLNVVRKSHVDSYLGKALNGIAIAIQAISDPYGEDIFNQATEKHVAEAKVLREKFLADKEKRTQGGGATFDDSEFLSLQEVKRRIEEIHRSSKFDLEINAELAIGAIDKTNAKIRALERERKALSDLNYKLPPGQIKDDVVKQIKDIDIDISGTKNKGKADFFKEQLDRNVKSSEQTFSRLIRLRDSLADFSQDNGPEATREVRKVDARIKAETSTINALESKLDSVRSENPGDDEHAQAIKSAEVHELENELISSRNRLEDLGVEKVQKQLEEVKKLNEERQRGIERAREGLAGLSDFDLIKTRILANDIKSGKQKPLTADQFFNLGQDQRKFLGETDKLFPGLGILPQRLDLGFGDSAFVRREDPNRNRISPDQQRAIDLATKQAGGLDKGFDFGGRISNHIGSAEEVPVNGQLVLSGDKAIRLNFDNLNPKMDQLSITIQGLQGALQALTAKLLPPKGNTYTTPYNPPVRTGGN